MSAFGRKIIPGKNSVLIEYCDICFTRSPNWLEISGDQPNGYQFRFMCDVCRTNEQTRSIDEPEQDMPVGVTDSDRPAWVSDFIEQGKGSLETINTNLAEYDWEEGEEREEIIEPVESGSWVATFIQEALFGDDPVKWLEDKGVFNEQEALRTLTSLSNLFDNQMESVRLAAIRSMYRIYQLHTQFKNQVSHSLGLFSSDSNNNVMRYANELINKID